MRMLRRATSTDRTKRGDDGLTVAERSERAKRYMMTHAGPLSPVERQFLAERAAARRVVGETSAGRDFKAQLA